MPGKVVSLRLEEGLLGRVDDRARELGKSRTEFLTWAMENALEDAGRGVPDLPPAAGPVEETVRRVEQRRQAADPGWTPSDKPPVDYARARQEKLNAEKYGRKR